MLSLMSWTAHLHPEMIGEAANLPRDIRVHFLIEAMRLESSGPLTSKLDCFTPIHPGLSSSRQRRFYKLGDVILAIDMRLLENRFSYLLITRDHEDEKLLTLAQKRAQELIDKTVEPVAFLDYLYDLPRDEHLEALDVIAAESTRRMRLAILKEAHLKARNETAAFFNYSKPHMEAFEKRLDYYLGVLNRSLEDREGQLTLQLNFKGGTSFSAASFGEILKLE